MSVRATLAFILTGILFVSLDLFAQADKVGFSYEITKNGASGLTLILKSNVSGENMWMGLSLYPANVKNTLEEGQHFAFPLKKGLYVREIHVEPELVNGTFEAALWTRRISKEDCPREDVACQKLGYKLEGMTAYIWAYLVTP